MLSFALLSCPTVKIRDLYKIVSGFRFNLQLEVNSIGGYLDAGFLLRPIIWRGGVGGLDIFGRTY